MNFNLSTKLIDVGYNVTKMLGRPGALVMKRSPEILMVTGTIGFVGTVVLASKAALKVENVHEFHQIKINHINRIRNLAVKGQTREPYTEEDQQKDLLTVYVQRTMYTARLFLPAIECLLSLGCFYGSHHILSKRNVAIAAAYKLVKESFDYYRGRVVDEYGPDKDYQFRHGLLEEQMNEAVFDENGKKKKTMKIVQHVDPNAPSTYAKFFDEASPRWSKSADYNLMFLRTQQSFLNDQLKIRGHVFLNEAYDCLGIPRTTEGAIVGWIYNSGGDDYIDFDIYNPKNADFVDGYEKAVLLDFNVDEPIRNLI